MKKSLKSIVVLVCICAVVAVSLAITNYITSSIIEENAKKQAEAALFELLPDGGSFELVDINGYTLPATVTEVYRAQNGGYVIKLSTTGYSSGMVIMCGISSDGTVVATKLLSSNETPAIGGVAAETLSSALVGKDIDGVDTVDTVSGATKTTVAYRDAIKDALNAVIILEGGTVDLRTDEEILNDNLSAALTSANGAFEKHFFVEVVEGVDAIYTAKNGTGSVCVIGESFIGVDNSGSVLTDCTDSEAETATTALSIIGSTTTTDVDLSNFEGTNKNLPHAKKTATGNYVFDIKAAGYGITGEHVYGPREHIVIRVSMTPEGKIIDCLTVSQSESKGIGSACADESFYGQFDGKTQSNYADVDAISGATVTTNAYKKAILSAFEAVNIFEGGDKQ